MSNNDGGNDWLGLGMLLLTAVITASVLISLAALTLATWGIIELVQWIGHR